MWSLALAPTEVQDLRRNSRRSTDYSSKEAHQWLQKKTTKVYTIA